MRVRERQLDAQHLSADPEDRTWPVPPPFPSCETFGAKNLIRNPKSRNKRRSSNLETRKPETKNNNQSTFSVPDSKRRLLGFLASRFKKFRDQRVPAFLIQFHVSHPEWFPTEDLDRDDWKRANRD